MNVSKLVEALDARIVRGDILGAFDEFFADHCVTLSSANDMTRGKAEKRQALSWFFDSMANTNRIERLNSRVEGDVSFSEFVFDFTDRQGRNHAWHEVIRRRWENGQVVEERYFTNLSDENPMTQGSTEKIASIQDQTVKAKTATRKKADAPNVEAEAKPMKESSPKKTAPAAGLSGTRTAKATNGKKASSASADNAGVNGEAAPAKKAGTRKK